MCVCACVCVDMHLCVDMCIKVEMCVFIIIILSLFFNHSSLQTITLLEQEEVKYRT